MLDLFGGSGSTLIAYQQTGRKAFLMELDPLYADVIIQRWETFADAKAERRWRRDSVARVGRDVAAMLADGSSRHMADAAVTMLLEEVGREQSALRDTTPL